jgi:hypothetical protein
MASNLDWFAIGLVLEEWRKAEIAKVIASYPPALLLPTTPAIQRALCIGPWSDAARMSHDPGDEDRSER